MYVYNIYMDAYNIYIYICVYVCIYIIKYINFNLFKIY